jgi:hypothetical protein
MASSLAMRSWEARQEKVTGYFMPRLLRGKLGIPRVSDPSDFRAETWIWRVSLGDC